MDQIEFADGFDTPDTLAFGLGAGQLAVVMAGALGAYSLMRSSLPPAVADSVAVLLAASAAALGWLKVAGRPALDWAIFAARFWMRPRHGVMGWTLSAATPGDTAAAPPGDAANEPQEPRLLRRLDALRDDFQIERVREGDDGRDDGHVLGIVGEMDDEGAVDLQRVDR